MDKHQRISNNINRVKSERERVYKNFERVTYSLKLRILNSLKLMSLQRIVNAILILKEAGVTEPTIQELSNASGLGTTSIKSNKEEIKQLILKVSTLGTTYGESYMFGEEGTLLHNSHQLDLNTNFDELSKLMVRLGFNPSIPNEINATTMKDNLASLVALSLVEGKIISSNLSALNQLNIAKNFLGFYEKVVSGSGRVHSNNKYRAYFHNSDNSELINSTFDKISNHQAGIMSMKFEPTIKCDEVMQKAMDYILMLNFEETPNIDTISTIEVPKYLLKQIKFRDAIIFLSNTVGYIDDNFIVALNKTDTRTDRVYSVFTSISSQTRLALGYKNYDIGAALQTICLQLIPIKHRVNFPLHQELVNDKQSFRNKVMQQTGKDLKWVKTELSKLDNKNRYNTQSSILREYFDEAVLLRTMVLETTHKNHSDIYSIAEINAKDELKKIWIEEDNKFEFQAKDGKKETSLFFFIWAQYERQIREAMKGVFTNKNGVLEVHDAIYSKEDIDIALLEESVRNNTGFEVKISH